MKHFIILCLCGLGCSVPKSNSKSDFNYQKVILTENIDLFGGIDFELSDNGRRGTDILVKYYDDTVRTLVTVNKQGKELSVYRLLIKGNQCLVTTENRFPRYTNVDSITFFSTQCFSKRTYYDFTSSYTKGQWAGKTTFSHYIYNNDKLFQKDINYYQTDSLRGYMPLAEFIQSTVQQHNGSYTNYRTLEAGINQKMSSLMFFRKYIIRE
jgi:hypothetical protein